MPIRTIVKEGDPCLAKKCRTVTEFNSRLHTLLDDMHETLADARGAGLAAPQVGVLRAGVRRDVTVPTVAAPDDPSQPRIGATVGVGYDHPGTVGFGIDPAISGPSAGLVLALAVDDRLTPGDLTGGRVIAATGTIDPDGTVGSIGGLPSKVAGAKAAGAALFLIPRGNCDEAVGLHTALPLVPVDNLQQAIDVLSRPQTPVAGLPHCS
ncbi:Peptide deformylase [bioreactor metagenome]|uniref:Peptide deformylase n=1 Tax=bioreactor metagenome TaxID=1076179 RepID=A0A645FIF6_9ZZZZ